MVNAFSFFYRILCDTPKKSRGKNLIIVAQEITEAQRKLEAELSHL